MYIEYKLTHNIMLCNKFQKIVTLNFRFSKCKEILKLEFAKASASLYLTIVLDSALTLMVIFEIIVLSGIDGAHC